MPQQQISEGGDGSRKRKPRSELQKFNRRINAQNKRAEERELHRKVHDRRRHLAVTTEFYVGGGDGPSDEVEFLTGDDRFVTKPIMMERDPDDA